LRLSRKYIYWPKREEVSNTFHELPYCIGYIYFVKIQAVCDHKLRIRDVIIGSPGSYHDSKIFKILIDGKLLKRHFSGNLWIEGGSALKFIYPIPQQFTSVGTECAAEFQ